MRKKEPFRIVNGKWFVAVSYLGGKDLFTRPFIRPINLIQPSPFLDRRSIREWECCNLFFGSIFPVTFFEAAFLAGVYLNSPPPPGKNVQPVCLTGKGFIAMEMLTLGSSRPNVFSDFFCRWGGEELPRKKDIAHILGT